MLAIESTNDIKQDNANLEQFVNKANTLGYDITIRVYYREHASIKFDDFGCGGNREKIVHILRNVRSNQGGGCRSTRILQIEATRMRTLAVVGKGCMN